MNDVWYAIGVRRALLQLSREARLDIVEYADIHAESLFHPRRLCPAVVKLHTPHFVLDRFYNSSERPYDTRLIKWAERRAIVTATGLSSPSRDLSEQVAAEYGLAASKIAHLPNGIDTDLFEPSEVEQEAPLTVLFVGRLERRKGARIFGDAIPRIAQAFPKAHFLFVGADRSNGNGASMRQELLARFEKGGFSARVAFEGHAAPEVFRAHYQRAAVFVMPSLFENCPYTLLEAMACGKAVVVGRAHGMQEMIVDGGSGLFFQPGDSVDLAEKVIRLLKDPDLRHRLGASARTTVNQRYSMTKAAEAVEQFYAGVISSWQADFTARS